LKMMINQGGHWWRSIQRSGPNRSRSECCARESIALGDRGHSIALESNRSTSAVITTIAANSTIRVITAIPTKLSAIIAPLVFIDSVASPITRTTGERLKIRISGTRKLPSNLRGEPEPKSVTNATLPRLELTKKGA
jgi:hypothetical protein